MWIPDSKGESELAVTASKARREASKRASEGGESGLPQLDTKGTRNGRSHSPGFTRAIMAHSVHGRRKAVFYFVSTFCVRPLVTGDGGQDYKESEFLGSRKKAQQTARTSLGKRLAESESFIALRRAFG